MKLASPDASGAARPVQPDAGLTADSAPAARFAELVVVIGTWCDAYLNGKLDLLQAEAVLDLVDGRSRALHRVAAVFAV